MPRAGTTTPYKPIVTEPLFIVNKESGLLLCNTNRLKPSFWAKQWLGAVNYSIKQSAWSRVFTERKKLGHFEFELMTMAEVEAMWRKQLNPVPPEPAKEPELLTVPEQERPPSSLADLAQAKQAAPVVVQPQAVAEAAEEVVDEARNELLMNAMATELSLMTEEATAYEMWTIAAAKLRNHKVHRQFLEESSAPRRPR